MRWYFLPIVFILAACSSALPTSTASPASGLRFASPRAVRAQAAVGVVDSSGNSAILVYAMGNEKNKPPFCEISETGGYGYPLTVDPNGNLWIPLRPTDSGVNSTVVAYKPSCGSRILRLEDPDAQVSDIAIAQDGTVYVANVNTGYDGPGDVLVYPKGQTTPSRYLGPHKFANPWGVAVDSLNNVYVQDVVGSSTRLLIFHNARGSGRRLKNFTTEAPRKIVFDKSNDLIVPADDATLLVYAPPYTAKPKTYALKGIPVQCALNAAQSTLACTDVQNDSVDVYSYPALTYRYSFSSGIGSQIRGIAESPL